MTEMELLKTEITLKLPLGAVNAILQALGAQPYAQVSDLVQAIREQATPQVPLPERKDQETPVQ